MGQYFFNATSSMKKIKEIEEDYRNLASAIKYLHTTINTYVCVDGKWFDDNAIVFAKWWNDNTSEQDNSLFGNLKWDDSQKMLVTDTSKNGQDGADRIVTLLNLAGKCFYVGVCKSLEALESSHTYIKIGCKKYLNVAHNNTYNLNKTGKIWRKMMFDSILNQNYNLNYITVPANSNGKTTNTSQLVDFQKKVEKDLNQIEAKVTKFCTDVSGLATNSDSSLWWGFSPDVRAQVQKLTTDARTRSAARIKSFKKNLNLAISKNIEVRKVDLSKIKEMKDYKPD